MSKTENLTPERMNDIGKELVALREMRVKHADDISEIEREVNRLLGGEASVGEVVALLLARGWMTPALLDTYVEEKVAGIITKLQARVDEFDRKRDSLMEDDAVGYATLNGAIMGLEIAIRSLSPSTQGDA